jgi:hypothetical protein
MSRTQPPVQDALDRYIEELMSRDNIMLLPDSVERRIYKRVLLKAVSDLRVILESTRIEFLGQIVTFRFEDPGTALAPSVSRPG